MSARSVAGIRLLHQAEKQVYSVTIMRLERNCIVRTIKASFVWGTQAVYSWNPSINFSNLTVEKIRDSTLLTNFVTDENNYKQIELDGNVKQQDEDTNELPVIDRQAIEICEFIANNMEPLISPLCEIY